MNFLTKVVRKVLSLRKQWNSYSIKASLMPQPTILEVNRSAEENVVLWSCARWFSTLFVFAPPKPDHIILIKEWFEFFLISISLRLLSYVSLPTTDTSAEERGCVCVCVCMCVGLLGRSLAAANIQLSVCWLSSVRRFVGLIILNTGWGQLLTVDNLEI